MELKFCYCQWMPPSHLSWKSSIIMMLFVRFTNDSQHFRDPETKNIVPVRYCNVTYQNHRKPMKNPFRVSGELAFFYAGENYRKKSQRWATSIFTSDVPTNQRTWSADGSGVSFTPSPLLWIAFGHYISNESLKLPSSVSQFRFFRSSRFLENCQNVTQIDKYDIVCELTLIVLLKCLQNHVLQESPNQINRKYRAEESGGIFNFLGAALFKSIYV